MKCETCGKKYFDKKEKKFIKENGECGKCFMAREEDQADFQIFLSQD